MRFPVVLATGNAHKAREICEIFAIETGQPLGALAIEAVDGVTIGFLVAPPDDLATYAARITVPAQAPDVEETGATLEANARIKAEGVGRALGLPVIADDTGLEVDALGGAPGVHSARYAGPDATDADNVVKLLGALAGLQGTAAPSTARFATVAYAWAPDRAAVVARGTVEGTIATAVRGEGGFGYDPVFVPAEGDGRTFAEMRADEKHAVSHRARAFRALAAQLAAVNSSEDH